jgi:hypothetical protein
MGEAVTPASDGVGIAVEFVGDLEVGGLVGGGAAEDDASAKGEGLGCEASVGDLLEAFAFFVGESDATGFTGHERTSMRWEEGTGGDRR